MYSSNCLSSCGALPSKMRACTFAVYSPRSPNVASASLRAAAVDLFGVPFWRPPYFGCPGSKAMSPPPQLGFLNPRQADGRWPPTKQQGSTTCASILSLTPDTELLVNYSVSPIEPCLRRKFKAFFGPRLASHPGDHRRHRCPLR